MPDLPPTEKETTVTGERRGGPWGMGPGSWAAIALIGFVILLLLLYLFFWRGDDGDSAPVSDRDVDVTQQDVDVDDEGDESGTGSGDEAGGDTGDGGGGGDTVVQEGDTVIIEPSEDGSGDEETARAIAEGGDVINQRRRSGEPAQVDVTIDETADVSQFDGARLRLPTDTEMQLSVTNDSDQAYNAYLELGGVTVASVEPVVAAGSTYEDSFTTPSAPGTYDVRVETKDGETVLTAKLVLEER